MSGPWNQVEWVPERVHRHQIRVLRGWVIALAIAAGIGVLIGGATLIGGVFSPSRLPVVVSSPRDCRVSRNTDAPKLLIAVDVTAMTRAYLINASPITGLARTVDVVDAAGVVRSLPPLSELDETEFVHIAKRSHESGGQSVSVGSTGVLVAVVDTAGQTSGHLVGLSTTWGLGEPAVMQDIPLGIDFTPTTCTVTQVG